MRSIREYFRVTIPLLAAMVLYMMFAVPWIEPKGKPPVLPKMVAVQRTTENYWWNSYFLPDAWQNQNPAALKTKNAVLLFQKSEKLTPDTLKLSPLTIILPRGTGDMLGSQPPKGDVLFIENPEGAEIQFAEAIDITGKPPDVIGGRLIGPILIAGPASSAGKTDLWLETRDIAIDHKHLWTLHPVKMRMGTSSIEGRDLSIYLDHNLLHTEEGAGGEESPFQGLDRMELMYLDRAEFDLPRGGIWSPKHSAQKLPAKVKLACKGSFQFDFHSLTAHLSSEVAIQHQVQGEAEDRFVCDDLRLRLGVPHESAPKTSPPNELAGSWSVEHLEATGKLHGDETHPGWWVQMEAPGMRTRAQGRHLEIDLVRGRLALSSQVGKNPRIASTRVFFEREGMRVWSPEIQMENEHLAMYTPKSATTHLGSLWADGPGSAQLQTEDQDEWKLSWSKRLYLQPDGEQDRLTVDGSANASSVRHGRFSSDVLDIWLFGIPEATQRKLAANTPGRKAQSIFADRFHARGQVLVDSPQLRAQVEDMQVWLVYPELARLNTNPDPIQSPLQSPIQLQSPSGVAQTSPITAPRAGRAPEPTTNPPSSLTELAANPITPNRSSSSPQSSNSPGRLAQFSDGSSIPFNSDLSKNVRTLSTPLSVTGPTLRSRILVEPKSTTIDDLEIEGGVTLLRDRVSEGSTLPLTITGDKLKMSTADAGMDVQILGRPALIKLGSGQLQGPEVRFNQQSQLVWMDHPGSLVLPPEVLTSTATPGQRNGIQWISPPLVEWKGNMTFDGRVARVGGGVRLTGDFLTDPQTRWVVLGDSESLEVHMTQPVAMGQPSMQPSEIDRVVLKNNVDIRATQSDGSGRFEKSRERLSVPELSFDMKNQTMLGAGPGWLRSRRPGQNGSVFGSHPLHCLHLTFAGQMLGAFAKGEVEFIDHIEALYGPIRNWEETLDVSQVQRLAVDQTIMTCDKLRINDTSDLSWNRNSTFAGGGAMNGRTMNGGMSSGTLLSGTTAWELIATGRVKIDSLTATGEISVRAPKVAYVGLKEMLSIEGFPYEPGEITLRKADRPNDPPSTIIVSSAEVNARTLDHGSIKLISATGSIGNPSANPGGLPGQRPPGGAPGTSPSSTIPSPRDFLPNRNKN